MEKPNVFTVFYAWQSDTPQSHGRYMIAEALQAAADNLSTDPSIPYRVSIDHDTLNETGLCDIPATILAKIDAADAMLVDLTYIARTQPDNGDPKSCSNPNVLFELGYAFRSMDPKRLVCVMNEKHGPKSDQIFDLNHRRHAIGYTSPHETRTKAQTTDALAAELVNALRPIVLTHGPRAISGDGSGRHASDRAQIEAISKSLPSRRPNVTTVTCCMNPQLYYERRWPDRPSLLDTLNRRVIQDGMVHLPLRIGDARGVPWGVYCDTESYNNDRWAMTYAGQFWFQFGLPTTADQGIYVDPSRPSERTSPAFIDAYPMIYELCSAFAVLSSMANDFHEGETLEISVAGDGFQGQHLGSTTWRMFQTTAPAISPGFSRNFKVSAGELASDWLTYCGDAAKEVCDLFTTAGNDIPRDAINRSLAMASEHKRIPPK
jgi:hypothetical protein